MGDAGSQLLGFGLACIGLAASWTAAGTTVATVLLPLLVLAIPILDTTLVTIVRLVERRPVTQGGKDHTSHRLVYYGLSEREAVGLLATVAVALGATGLAYNVLDNARVTSIGVLLSVVLLVQFGNFLTELREHSEEHTARSRRCARSLLAPRRRDRDRRRLRPHVRLVPRRLRDRRRTGSGRSRARRRSSPRCRSCSARATSASSSAASTAASGATRRRRTSSSSPSPASSPAVLSWLIVASIRGVDRFPGVGLRPRRGLRIRARGGSRLAFRGFVEWRGRPPGEGDLVARCSSSALARWDGASRARSARRRGSGSSGSSTTTPPSAGDGSRASACSGRSPRSSARSRQSAATEVVVTIADAPPGPARAPRAPPARSGGILHRHAPADGAVLEPPAADGRGGVSASSSGARRPALDSSCSSSSTPATAALAIWQAHRAPDADDLHGRARDDPARAVARRDRVTPRCAGMPSEHARAARRVSERAVLVDRRRADRVLADQGVERAVMALVVFPAYGLARLVVSPRWALFAAAGTGLSPALAYAPILVKEPTAYPGLRRSHCS